jgi:5-oxoprolinase (ATP-hydrolysing)
MMTAMSGQWQIWIDTGGTFTDCLAVDPDGAWHRVKVLTSGALRGSVEQALDASRLRICESWSAPDGFATGLRLHLLSQPGAAPVEVTAHVGRELELAGPVRAEAGATFEVRTGDPAPLLAARLVTRTPAGAPLPPHRLRLATTLGTNALLQRRGAALALFVSAGFADLLRVGTQQRPDLFALSIARPAPLPETVVEVPERVAVDGEVLRPLDLAAVEHRARELHDAGIRVAAVALVNSYRWPEHERRVCRALRQVGFEHVCSSAELSPLISLLSRAETAVVNAYLTPILEQFLRRIEQGSGASPLMVMTSTGGMVRGSAFAPKDSLLSGPAGGVVGAAAAGRLSGFERVISFDMGGTSTDVARFDGDYDYRFEQRVGDARLASPAMAIETVAAGGGSICAIDEQGALAVGPGSAGADPGPACYGAGGPLTLTDVNLLLGRLDPTQFRFPVSRERARRALGALEEQLDRRPDTDQLLEGLLELANERMADAIRRVSLRRGYDPHDYTLVAFGGAGPQHACGVAERLGIQTVLGPRDAGLLSARGMGQAAVERFATRQVLRPLSEVEDEIDGWLDELAREAREALLADGVPEDQAATRRRIAGLRLLGQDTAITLDVGPGPLAELFAARFEALYGYQPGREQKIEVESLRVVVSDAGGIEARGGPFARGNSGTPGAARRDARTRSWRSPAARWSGATNITARFNGEWHDAPCFRRDALDPTAPLDGPAVVVDPYSTTVVEPGWRAGLDRAGALVLRRSADLRPVVARAEAVELELFVGRLAAIAEQMGELLRRTALSTNIKERLDFSCAVLDDDGELVVNAPHIPVHLGSLGLCVRRLAETVSMGPGDVVVTNHPAFGGSHLPDVTVVSPVHSGDRLVGYVVSRAHHAEIGGDRPGSMSPSARRLVEEGVVIAPLFLFSRGEPRWEALEEVLRRAPFPSRAVSDNLADVAAQVAANRQGAAALGELAESSDGTLRRHMEALKARAERHIRSSLAALPDGDYRARDALDDGTPLAVRVTISGDHARVDFTGTGGVHPGNLNATPAIVRGVVIYVLRLLVRRALPLNEGLMRAVELVIPDGSLLSPGFPDDPAQAPAVVGGNVETSQRLVDLLLSALGLCACSQGTMNNVVFGNAGFGYYETVGGGAGAGPGFDGESGVHTHMTNTRITDVEVVEQRYPVRVERFGLRRGSGGAGSQRGGDGLVRELCFLEPVELSLLTQRRSAGPCGLGGGEPGQPGEQRLIRADGEPVKLAAVDGCQVRPGDRLVLETPGGGGYGPPED